MWGGSNENDALLQGLPQTTGPQPTQPAPCSASTSPAAAFASSTWRGIRCFPCSIPPTGTMTGDRVAEFDFAAEHDVPIPYLQRIRDYYQALGYGAPYEWAHYADVPFRPLARPLAACRVAIVTTAAPRRPGQGDPRPGA